MAINCRGGALPLKRKWRIILPDLQDGQTSTSKFNLDAVISFYVTFSFFNDIILIDSWNVRTRGILRLAKNP